MVRTHPNNGPVLAFGSEDQPAEDAGQGSADFEFSPLLLLKRLKLLICLPLPCKRAIPLT
jgi:hypothetical protein